MFNKVKNKLKLILNLEFQFQLMYNRMQFAVTSAYLRNSILKNSDPGTTDTKYCKEKVVVSLTTYSKRIHDVYLTIESLMHQTYKANRIILWLADELKDKELPQTLILQQNRGLEVRYCEDIKSYKKLIPALKEFPDDIIITVDDDAIYNIDMLENLIKAYQKNSSYVYFYRGHLMTKRSNNELNDYNQWKWYKAVQKANVLNFPTGIGGILYPPDTFNDEVFNKEVYMEICRYADDVWFKAMALLNNRLASRVITRNANGEEYFDNPSGDDVALGLINQKQNDIQIKAVFERYNLFDKL